MNISSVMLIVLPVVVLATTINLVPVQAQQINPEANLNFADIVNVDNFQGIVTTGPVLPANAEKIITSGPVKPADLVKIVTTGPVKPDAIIGWAPLKGANAQEKVNVNSDMIAPYGPIKTLKNVDVKLGYIEHNPAVRGKDINLNYNHVRLDNVPENIQGVPFVVPHGPVKTLKNVDVKLGYIPGPNVHGVVPYAPMKSAGAVQQNINAGPGLVNGVVPYAPLKNFNMVQRIDKASPSLRNGVVPYTPF